MNYTVTGSQTYFEEWTRICHELDSLKSLIQNDGVEVTAEDLLEWNTRLVNRLNDLVKLKTSVVVQIMSSRH